MATVKQTGGDYSTLNAAFAAAETTIDIQGTWTAADTTKATCSTASTTVTADASSKHGGRIEASPTYYRLEGSGGHCITVSATNLTITGIVIKQAGTGGSDEGVRMNGAHTLTLKDCIIYANDTRYNDQDGVYNHQNNCTVNLTQCIIYNFSRAGVHDQSQNFASTAVFNINSCTIFNCARSGEGGNDAGGIAADCTNASSTLTFNIHNTIVIKCDEATSAEDYFARGTQKTAVVWNISNSIDGDNSIAGLIDTGTGNLASRVETDSASPGAGDWVIFNDITTYPFDLRLKDHATENDAKNMHAVATAHSLTIPANDIVGTSRPQDTNYDCGAFEIVAAAAAAPTMPGRHRHFANLLNH